MKAIFRGLASRKSTALASITLSNCRSAHKQGAPTFSPQAVLISSVVSAKTTASSFTSPTLARGFAGAREGNDLS